MGSSAYLLFILIVNLLIAVEAGNYYPFTEYAGSTFFDGWNFTSDWDETNLGRVIWVDRQTATTSNLTFINSAGNAIIKVDNHQVVQNVTNPTRNSVKISSNETYGAGNLIIIDVVHLPYGCSVWPAFWTLGPGVWPEGGEIDIIEGVNLMTSNQYALHTTPGCTVSPGGNMTGSLKNQDCATASAGGKGCSILETNPSSFGDAFSNAGGGVWATQIDVSGVYIWFWSRRNVPNSIKSATSQSQIDISGWGAPSAAFPTTNCYYAKYFKPQQLVLSINICGSWAGNQGIYSSMCQPPNATLVCNDYVVGAGSPKYDDAYWEISYIRTYVMAGSQPGAPSGSAGVNPTTSGTGSGALPTGSTKNSASRWQYHSAFSFSVTAALVLFGLL